MRVREWLTRKNCFGSLVFLILVGSASRIINGGSRSHNQASDTWSAFPQAEVRRSSDGVLTTTLRTSIAPNTLVDQFSHETRLVDTPTFEGTIPGPTLLVEPGDTLSIDLVNDFPPNPEVQRMSFSPTILAGRIGTTPTSTERSLSSF